MVAKLYYMCKYHRHAPFDIAKKFDFAKRLLIFFSPTLYVVYSCYSYIELRIMNTLVTKLFQLTPTIFIGNDVSDNFILKIKLTS